MSLSHRVELGWLCRLPALDRHQDGSPAFKFCVPFDGCRAWFLPASSRRKPGIRLPSATRRFAGCLQIECLGHELESVNARGLCGPTSVLRGSGHGRVRPWLRSVAQAKRNRHDHRTSPFSHRLHPWANSNQPAGRSRGVWTPPCRTRARQPETYESASRWAQFRRTNILLQPALGFPGLCPDCNGDFPLRIA